MKKTKRQIEKLLFSEKVELDFVEIKKDLQLATVHGAKHSINTKSIIVISMIAITIACAILVYFTMFYGRDYPEPNDGIYYFNDGTLAKEPISKPDNGAKYIISPTEGQFYHYTSDDVIVLYEQYISFEDDMNYDKIVLKTINANYKLPSIENVIPNKHLNRNGIDILYDVVEDEIFLTYSLKFTKDEHIYLLSVNVLDDERMLFYLDQLLK